MRISRARVIALVFGLMALGSWAPVLWLWSQGLGWSGPAGRALAVWYAFPALIATLFVQGPILKQPVLGPLGFRLSLNRWWLVAWLTPLAVLAVALAAQWLMGFDPVLTVEELVRNKRSLLPAEQLESFDRYLEENEPPHPLMLVLLGLPAGLTFNLLIALCSEVAFRGFFFRELPGGFWQRATLIGLLWWLWLAPAIAIGNLYGERGLPSVLLALPWCVLASWVLVYLRVRCDSIIAVSMTSGTILALAGAAYELSFGAPWWVRPFYGVSGTLGLALVWLGMWMHDRRRSTGKLTGGAAHRADQGTAGGETS